MTKPNSVHATYYYDHYDDDYDYYISERTIGKNYIKTDWAGGRKCSFRDESGYPVGGISTFNRTC